MAESQLHLQDEGVVSLTTYALAVDIGASSGRLILGNLQNRKLTIEEIHRFENKVLECNNHIFWDLDHVFSEIIKGIHICKVHGITPVSIGIDTWGVDFVLLDEDDTLLTDAVTYRDSRTDGIMEEVFQRIPKKKIYERTGIQFLKFNTIFQLYALNKTQPEIMEKAKTFLMIPDYLNFLLTGVKVNEYTNSTTTQLVNAYTKNWDYELIRELGFKEDIFQEIKPPKTILGNLKKEWASQFGFDMKVVLPATHDTGSAVVSVPEKNDTIYISSGTWSLMGIENPQPICDSKALQYNFTNEGGLDYRYRILKNIMGLWMLQEVKRNYQDEYSFLDLQLLVKQAKDFHAIVEVNDERFLRPNNMIEAIQNYCIETNQSVPQLPGEVAKCIFDSLTESYNLTMNEIENLAGRTFKSIHVIGGGSQNDLLNQLVADVSKRDVYAGPVEATAIGNISAQLLALGVCIDINQVRDIIKNSFKLNKYTYSPKMA